VLCTLLPARLFLRFFFQKDLDPFFKLETARQEYPNIALVRESFTLERVYEVPFDT